MYNEKYSLKRFLEPCQFLSVNGGKCLWSYFRAFKGAGKEMKKRCSKKLFNPTTCYT